MNKKEINKLVDQYNKMNKKRKMLFGKHCSNKPRGHYNLSVGEIKEIQTYIKSWGEVFEEHGIIC